MCLPSWCNVETDPVIPFTYQHHPLVINTMHVPVHHTYSHLLYLLLLPVALVLLSFHSALSSMSRKQICIGTHAAVYKIHTRIFCSRTVSKAWIACLFHVHLCPTISFFESLVYHHYLVMLHSVRSLPGLLQLVYLSYSWQELPLAPALPPALAALQPFRSFFSLLMQCVSADAPASDACDCYSKALYPWRLLNSW